jgi:hypothetical protein
MRRLAHITALIALIAVASAAPLSIDLAARAQDANAAASPPAAGPNSNSEPASTAVSGVDVVARKTVTEVEGLDVVVTRKQATEVDGVEVKAPENCLPPRSPADKAVPAPKLVSTYPAQGQTVQPGYLVLRLTFDLPMACRGSLPQDLLAACFSEGVEIWHESVDRKSLLIACNLKPDTHYELGINHRIPDHFQGLSGNEPDDGLFSFETSGEAPVTTPEAMVARDTQLAALLARAASAGYAAPAPQAAAPLAANTVSTVKVEETHKCLPPRYPPDPDVPAPKLVSTFPAQGQTVRPGIIELRFTFDLPMACRGAVAVKAGDRNPCIGGPTSRPPFKFQADHDADEVGGEHWVQPWDRHTMLFQCRIEPGKHYAVYINTNIPGQPRQNFQGLGGKPAEPYQLTFTASSDAPVQTEEEADNQDPQLAALLNGHWAIGEQ